MMSVPEATPSVPKSVVLIEPRSCSWDTNYADSKTPVRRLATVLVAQATQVEQPRPVLVHVHPPVQSTSVYAEPKLPVNRAEHEQASALVVNLRTWASRAWPTPAR